MKMVLKETLSYIAHICGGVVVGLTAGSIVIAAFWLVEKL